MDEVEQKVRQQSARYVLCFNTHSTDSLLYLAEYLAESPFLMACQWGHHEAYVREQMYPLRSDLLAEKARIIQFFLDV